MGAAAPRWHRPRGLPPVRSFVDGRRRIPAGQSRVLVIAGKGGVGKTTITAALARMAARAGLDVLVVELEGKPGITTAFGGSDPLAYSESSLTTGPGPFGIVGDDGQAVAVGRDARDQGGRRPGTVLARRITPDDALLEYLADHGMGRISKRLVSSGAPRRGLHRHSRASATSWCWARSNSSSAETDADLILVDAPATGHAMTFLSSAQGLLDAARSGPVRAQAADVVDLLDRSASAARSPSSPCPRRCRSTRSSRRPTNSRTRSASPSDRSS